MKRTLLAMILIALFVGMAFTTMGTDIKSCVKKQGCEQSSAKSRPIITGIILGSIKVESFKPGIPWHYDKEHSGAKCYFFLDVTGTVTDPGNVGRVSSDFRIGHFGWWITGFSVGSRVRLQIFFLNNVPNLEVGEECNFGFSRGVLIRAEELV
jgi:hypothetical protein